MDRELVGYHNARAQPCVGKFLRLVRSGSAGSALLAVLLSYKKSAALVSAQQIGSCKIAG